MADRTRARQLAAEYIAAGKPLDWFDALYREAEAGESVIPWADLEPNAALVEFWKQHPLPTLGRKALTVGCGLGDDAEQLAAWGFDTTAFDISPTAIDACRRRFPDSCVHYAVANLLNPPREWTRAFDFVLEAYTLQAIPKAIRKQALLRLVEFAADEGELLLIARGRDEEDPADELPWPLTKREMNEGTGSAFRNILFEDYMDAEDPPKRRFRALYRRG